MQYLFIFDLHNTLLKDRSLMINAMQLVLQDIIKIAYSDRVSPSQILATLKEKNHKYNDSCVVVCDEN